MYPLYEHLCGHVVASVQESVTFGCAGETDVGVLGVAIGTPLVLTDRLAVGFDGKPIEWRRVRAHASDFHYQFDIR